MLSKSSISSSMTEAGIFTLRVDRLGKIQSCNQEFASYFQTDVSSLENQHFETLNQLAHPEVSIEIIRGLETVKSGQHFLEKVKDSEQITFSINILEKDGYKDVVLKDITEEAKLKAIVQQYISPHLDDLTPEERSSFEYPERRFMSVSFTDLRGFTSMSEGLSPEEVRDIINAYLEEVIRAVDENGDTVDKIVGDELMALYGAPRYFENHAFRSIKTSWDQILNLREMQNIFKAQGKHIPHCGIGVNTGDMVLGNIGGGSRQDYTVLGAAVNLGARLCDHAGPGQILCSHMTMEAVLTQLPPGWDHIKLEEDIEEPLKNGEILRGKRNVIRIGENVSTNPRNASYKFIELPAIAVKGIEKPVPIYSVIGTSKTGNVFVKNDIVSREECLRIFGEYRLLKEVGRGGMGQVYLAKDSFDNQCAIKLLLAKQNANEEQLVRFTQEASIMAKLNHRHICRINKLGEIEKSRFISMEYIDGPSLDSLIEDNGLNLEALYENSKSTKVSSIQNKKYSPKQKYKDRDLIHFTLEFFSEMLTGLIYAHQHGIIHRDLKPSNIMCRKEGEPVIMDFGLAKLHDTDLEVSQSGNMVGTIEYIAPEQASGSSAVDMRADIYSAASILYYILTGHKHFETSGNILTDINSLKEFHPKAPSTHRKSINEDLDIVILTALDPDPEKRYRDTELFLSDIKACLEDKPIMARRQSQAERFWRTIKRHKALSGTIAASICIITYLFISHYFAMSHTLNEYQRVEKIANEEKAKAQKQIASLRKSLEKSIERKDWATSKDLAYKIIGYDRNDKKAKDIINKTEYELLKIEWPLIIHPPSGFKPRINYLEKALTKWKLLSERKNTFAKKEVLKIEEKLKEEKEMMPHLEALFEEYDLKNDGYGYYLILDNIKFRYIPPGRFQMGDMVSQPIHEVLIDRGFFISETEVSQEIWTSIFDINPSTENDNEKLPLTNITWAESLTFCNALNEKYNYQTIDDEDISRVHLSLILNRRGFRLPTEAEWEYACRADQKNKYNFWFEDPEFEYDHSIPPVWYKETSGASMEERRNRPIGQHAPNPWGIKDMNGNVAEWVMDTYDEYFYRMSRLKNPVCSKATGPGVIRGGSVENSLFMCRNGSRTAIDNDISHKRIGFRLYFSP